MVNLKTELIELTAPFEFINAVVGGSVPRQYISAVKNGVEKATCNGGPRAISLVGLRATLYNDKAHSVDSSEARFETAASIGRCQALKEAGTVVLKRTMTVSTAVPADLPGDLLNDFSVLRGTVISTARDDELTTVVSAHVPESELLRYGLDLRNLSTVLARTTITLHHLVEVTKVPSAK